MNDMSLVAPMMSVMVLTERMLSSLPPSKLAWTSMMTMTDETEEDEASLLHWQTLCHKSDVP